MNSITTTVLLAVGVAAVPTLAGRPTVLWLGAVGALLTVGSVFAGRVFLLAFGAMAYLGEATAAIGASSDRSWWVAGFAGGLLVLLDVGVGTMERRTRQAGAHGPQLLRILALAALGLTVGVLVLLLAKLPIEGGVLMQAAGIGAVTALLLGLVQLDRQKNQQ